MLRATLHPDGAAPRIANFTPWSRHLLRRLEREVAMTGDRHLAARYDEFLSYPGVYRDDRPLPSDPGDIVASLRVRHPDGELSFFTTVTYPADRDTANRLPALLDTARLTPE